MVNEVFMAAFNDELEKIAIKLSTLEAAASKIDAEKFPLRKAFLDARAAEKDFGQSQQGKNLVRLRRSMDPDVYGQALELEETVLDPLLRESRDAGSELRAKLDYDEVMSRSPAKIKRQRQLSDKRMELTGTFMNPFRRMFFEEKSPFQLAAAKRRLAKLSDG